MWFDTRDCPWASCPELVFSRITVVAPGAALGARQILFTVTRPIEEAVSIVPGVTRVQSRSIRVWERDGRYVQRRQTTMIYALQQVQARVNQIRGDPAGRLDIEIERLTPSLFPILSYNLEGGDPARLYDVARYQIKHAQIACMRFEDDEPTEGDDLYDEDDRDDNPGERGPLRGVLIGPPFALATDCGLVKRNDEKQIPGCCACVSCDNCGQVFRIDLLSAAGNHACPKCKLEYTSILIVATADDHTMLQYALEQTIENGRRVNGNLGDESVDQVEDGDDDEDLDGDEDLDDEPGDGTAPTG